MRRCACLVVVSVFLVATFNLAQTTSHKNQHPGAVVDAYSLKGMVADAYAYASQSPSTGSGCPTFSTPLDSQKSTLPGGDFTFHIESQTSSYLAVYCEQGYAPRTETINDNSVDMTRVQPDPIKLYPTSHIDISSTVARTAIASDLDGLHENLSYYRQANPDAFAAAQRSPIFSDDDRNVINTIVEKQEPFSPKGRQPQISRRQKSIDNPKIAFVAMVTDLNNVRSDFGYYQRADSDGYSEALKSWFRPRERGVIEAIRTRSEPFDRPSQASVKHNEINIDEPHEPPMHVEAPDVRSSEECTNQAWVFFNKNDYASAIDRAQLCIYFFRGKANDEEKDLEEKREPVSPTGQVDPTQKERILKRSQLNDVATCYFIEGKSHESLYLKDKTLKEKDAAVEAYVAGCKYKYARTWDPKGWLWSPAAESRYGAERLGAQCP
jgi:hypothetical protein